MQSFCNPIASQESHLAGLFVTFGYNFAQHHESKEVHREGVRPRLSEAHQTDCKETQ